MKNIIFIITGSAVWLMVWLFTQGLLMESPLFKMLPGSIELKTWLVTAYILAITCLVLIVFSRLRKRILTRSKWLYLYSIPLVALALVPFHYQLALPTALYMVMIPVTVFWQDYLTFGLLQTCFEERLPRYITPLVVGTLFGLGHLIPYIQSIDWLSGPTVVIQAASYFVVGYTFAFLRTITGQIYPANILHLSFLLIIV